MKIKNLVFQGKWSLLRMSEFTTACCILEDHNQNTITFGQANSK